MRIIFKLLLLVAIAQSNDEFIVSYKAIIKNQILFGEEYNVVKSLTISDKYTIVGRCDFIPDEIEAESNLIEILRNNKEMVLDCLHKNISAKISDNVKFIDNAINFKTKFEFKPHRILAFFDGNKVDIKFIEKLK
ncbi:hypothetical protein [Helicobacter sp. MIT 99-5507]|uniref:hypothetical protein n=1 Tax=Helicobacter sp. MIT 99-5507 TaxID=152489 RepID=UPI000E1F9DDE|nr:hypothetical protein [Helicobacter sp. MIT 99-5507]RDU58279.1 hypothetical protein CQA42_00280 [Helicobacter sp. MIT 99-5507]